MSSGGTLKRPATVQVSTEISMKFRVTYAHVSQINYEQANALMIAEQINAGAIDKIFSNSVTLNSAAIEEFTKALCAVSIDEISAPNPRIFSLQKLVELAHFNMNRVRLVWSRVWNVLATHFTKVKLQDIVYITIIETSFDHHFVINSCHHLMTMLKIHHLNMIRCIRRQLTYQRWDVTRALTYPCTPSTPSNNSPLNSWKKRNWPTTISRKSFSSLSNSSWPTNLMSSSETW